MRAGLEFCVAISSGVLPWCSTNGLRERRGLVSVSLSPRLGTPPGPSRTGEFTPCARSEEHLDDLGVPGCHGDVQGRPVGSGPASDVSVRPLVEELQGTGRKASVRAGARYLRAARTASRPRHSLEPQQLPKTVVFSRGEGQRAICTMSAWPPRTARRSMVLPLSSRASTSKPGVATSLCSWVATVEIARKQMQRMRFFTSRQSVQLAPQPRPRSLGGRSGGWGTPSPVFRARTPGAAPKPQPLRQLPRPRLRLPRSPVPLSFRAAGMAVFRVSPHLVAVVSATSAWTRMPRQKVRSLPPILRERRAPATMSDVLLAQLAALPLPQMVAAGVAFFLASVLVSSFLFRTLLRPKNSPPYVNCMPLIGGISKFIKVWTVARRRKERMDKRTGESRPVVFGGVDEPRRSAPPPTLRRARCSSWASATPSTARCSLCLSCTSGSPFSSARR